MANNPKDKLDFRCEKCGRTLKGVNFYNSAKYASGKMPICKKCATMNVDCWDPSTFLWILQECDRPYVPEEWNKTVMAEQQKGREITGLLIIGKYLSKMHLGQWGKYRWADTEGLQQIAEKRIREAMERQGYSQTDITKVVEEGHFDLPDKPMEIPADIDSTRGDVEEYLRNRKLPEKVGMTTKDGKQIGSVPLGPMVNGKPAFDDPSADFYDESAREPVDDPIVASLTDDDKTYLRLKWGKDYTPFEWVALEKLYQEMMDSYDIQAAGHLDNLKLLCKTSLKCNQLIDINDVEGYQKMSRVYDTLMKNGHFTAAQQKETTEGVVDSVGELVAMCEKDAFIPRYYVEKPADKVDQVIFDLQQYTKNLITEELGMGNLLENALKKLYEEHNLLDKTATDGETTSEEDLLLQYEDHDKLNDDDYLEFQEVESQWAAADTEMQEKGENHLK